ncbi:MAG: large conductance mechanosensitive channel protein MscL [Coriobacteriia bacterium]|nr:large conductance mechanosensitive channel protein MscL [Coriobacteriia bacterium]
MRKYLAGLYEEFKEFISRGNIVDVAVAVIIGGAFTGIINALVSELFMPLVGILTGGIDFSTWSVTVADVPLHVGNIITAIVNFFILALILFAVIKSLEKMRHVKDFAVEQYSQVLGADDEPEGEVHPDEVREETVQ